MTPMKKDLRTTFVQIRVSPKEKREMEKMAEALEHESVSAYLRSLHREAMKARTEGGA